MTNFHVFQLVEVNLLYSGQYTTHRKSTANRLPVRNKLYSKFISLCLIAINQHELMIPQRTMRMSA